MKLLLNSHVSVDVCLLLALLPVFSLAQPHTNGSRRENLKKLYDQMRFLTSIARGPFTKHDMNLDINHNFTALPHITSRAQDLRTQQLNTTLLQLHSGIQSLKFHFDWLQQVQQNRSMKVPPVTKRIMNYLKNICHLLQKQIEDPLPKLVPPQLPQLTNSWDIHTSSIKVHQSLQNFCHWSSSALHFLMMTPL